MENSGKRQLANLLDSGLITKDEYEERLHKLEHDEGVYNKQGQGGILREVETVDPSGQSRTVYTYENKRGRLKLTKDQMDDIENGDSKLYYSKKIVTKRTVDDEGDITSKCQEYDPEVSDARSAINERKYKKVDIGFNIQRLIIKIFVILAVLAMASQLIPYIIYMLLAIQ